MEKVNSYRKAKNKKAFKYKDARDKLEINISKVADSIIWFFWLLVVIAILLFGIFINLLVG